MKKDIHPKYKELTLIIGGDRLSTMSTMNARNGEYLVDVDYRKHPAWNKSIKGMVNQSNKNISNFNQKFAGLTL